MKTNMRVIVAAALGLLLLVGAAIPVVTQPAPVQALSVTPVANLVTSNARQLFQPMTVKGITADYNTEAMEISSFSWADVEYTVDQATVNTTTVTIQYSNDKSNWVNGDAIVTDNAADATDMTRIPLFGQYMRFNVNVAGSDRITWTISALAR